MVKEDIGSDTKIKRNNFKTAIKTFTEQMKNIANNINDSIKTKQEKMAKYKKAAWFENLLIFQIDDKLIPNIDAPENCTSAGISRAVISGSSIALAP